jgi:hypothetical protein
MFLAVVVDGELHEWEVAVEILQLLEGMLEGFDPASNCWDIVGGMLLGGLGYLSNFLLWTICPFSLVGTPVPEKSLELLTSPVLLFTCLLLPARLGEVPLSP